MWKEVIPIMQNWTGCANLGMEETITMKDDRDYPDNLYTVAKLKDGRCWMTQNLRMAKEETILLTNEDSDLNDTFTLPRSSSTGWSYGQGTTLVMAYLYPEKSKEFGVYYSWGAATAGAKLESARKNGESVDYSICPKGWSLPTKDEATKLSQNYNGNTVKTYPANFISGSCGYNNAIFCNRSNDFIFLWTSTGGVDWGNGRDAYPYGLYIEGSSFTVQTYEVTGRGFPIRCIKR